MTTIYSNLTFALIDYGNYVNYEYTNITGKSILSSIFSRFLKIIKFFTFPVPTPTAHISTVLCPFLTRDHTVTVPRGRRYRS
jgi:hypothetical protein